MYAITLRNSEQQIVGTVYQTFPDGRPSMGYSEEFSDELRSRFSEFNKEDFIESPDGHTIKDEDNYSIEDFVEWFNEVSTSNYKIDYMLMDYI